MVLRLISPAFIADFPTATTELFLKVPTITLTPAPFFAASELVKNSPPIPVIATTPPFAVELTSTEPFSALILPFPIKIRELLRIVSIEMEPAASILAESASSASFESLKAERT